MPELLVRARSIVIVVSVGLGFFLCRKEEPPRVQVASVYHGVATSPVIDLKQGVDSSTDKFVAWVSDYINGIATVEKGLGYARDRRRLINELIREDPDAALAMMLPLQDYELLPGPVRKLVEKPFAVRADVTASADCGSAMMSGQMRYAATWGGEDRALFLARGREGLLTKRDVSLSGIHLDGVAAIHASPLWAMSESDRAAAQRLFKLDQERDGSMGTFAGWGQALNPNPAELSTLKALLRQAETIPGPDTVSVVASALMKETVELSVASLSTAVAAVSASWTQSPKAALLIRAEFPDLGLVWSQTQLEALLESVSDRLDEMSHGQTYLSTMDVTETVFELPQATSYYEALASSPLGPMSFLHGHAQDAAEADGIDPDVYDFVVVLIPHITLPLGDLPDVGGLADVGGPRILINGNLNLNTYIHEFGHGYGLRHASAWWSGDNTPMPDPGEALPLDPPEHLEYGDGFDIMGSGEGDFHPHAKRRLNWIPESKVGALSSLGSGTYRLYRFDHEEANENALLALRLQISTSEVLWVSYRRGLSPTDPIGNGAYVLWEYEDERTRLVDASPGSHGSSSTDLNDAPLALGETFIDPTGYVQITPLAQGGSGADEWLDVEVTLGEPGNQAPNAGVVSGPTMIQARDTYTFSISASDPDGDSLRYFWDFGGGFVYEGSHMTEVQLPFASQDYLTVAVDDERGGRVVVRHDLDLVPDPLTHWTELANTDVGIRRFKTVLHAKGRFLLACEAYDKNSIDLLFESLDGLNWKSLESEVEGAALIFADDQFMMAGRLIRSGAWQGAIQTSSNGRDWELADLPHELPFFEAIAHGQNTSVVAGRNSTIYRRLGEGPWEPQSSGTEAFWLNGALYHNGYFYVYSNQSRDLLRSADGASWEDISASSGLPEASTQGLIAYNGKLYLSSVGVWESADHGETWTGTNFPVSPGGAFQSTGALLECRGFLYAGGARVFPESRFNVPENYLSLDQGQTWAILAGDGRSLSSRLAYGAGRVLSWDHWRLETSGMTDFANRPPLISLSLSGNHAAREVTLTLTQAEDPDGDELYYLWNFGDGNEYWGNAFETHQYASEGVYMATVSVADGRGGVVKASAAVDLEARPGNSGNQDSDEWLDLLEYALGSSRQDANSTPSVAAKIVPSEGADCVEFTIPKNPLVNDVEIVPEISDDLLEWRFGPEFFSIVEETSVLLRVRTKGPLSALGERFLRVRVIPID